MDRLTETLEAIQEELADDEFDIEYSVSSNHVLVCSVLLCLRFLSVPPVVWCSYRQTTS